MCESVDLRHHNLFMSLSTIVLIVALVVFVVAAIGWKYKKLDLIATGLALVVLAELLGAVRLG